MYYLSTHITFESLNRTLKLNSDDFLNTSRSLNESKEYRSYEAHLNKFYRSSYTPFINKIKNKKLPFIYDNYLFYNRNEDGTLTKESFNFIKKTMMLWEE